MINKIRRSNSFSFSSRPNALANMADNLEVNVGEKTPGNGTFAALFYYTVNSLLTDTSIKRTPP